MRLNLNQMSPPPARAAWCIGALYVATGIAWVLWSDALLLTFSRDTRWLSQVQDIKGVLYVTVTGLCLVWLVTMANRPVCRREAHFRQLHESLGDVVWMADAKTVQHVYVSSAFEQLYGRPAAELAANRELWREVVFEEDRQVTFASHEALAREGSATCEYRIRRPDGTVRWISDRKRAIRDEDGQVRLIGGVAEDITASKELEAVRELSRLELERTVALRTAQLQQANEELEAFARTAAHDLKSPLHGIAGLSELLLKGYGTALGEEGTRLARHMHESAHRMALLVDDLLNLSRVQNAPLQKAEIDLVSMVSAIVRELQHREPSRAVTLSLPDHVVVNCDPGLAHSLMVNVIGNAWKFTSAREYATIALSAAAEEAWVRIDVQDNGVGFDPGKGGKVFVPFQRFHRQGEYPGTGIGLVTCQRIVQRHGGTISVVSQPGAGTKVSFTLPASKPRYDASSEASQPRTSV